MLLVIDSPDAGSGSRMYDECYGSLLSLQLSPLYHRPASPIRAALELRMQSKMRAKTTAALHDQLYRAMSQLPAS